ncbi:S-adenosyl-L-methionine-dependent methyltransferase [Testicularia cyperi]|uniref:S-adenosyl-L-methionine-dependent methyltransferase n=1 Tax=Testicularia cyperi TaxID=1882483 RepID=A0A317XGX2_9BASI|nr:S-adenosyl-L-methionine-dependent methyltransferase [Testicularia cyperi]
MASWVVEQVFWALSKVRLVPSIPAPFEDRLARLPPEATSIDNDIYNQASFDWTEGGCGLHLLNPVRVGYFLDKLERYELSRDDSRSEAVTVLDLGCGAGIATEAVYRALDSHRRSSQTSEQKRTYRVIGIDMSRRSIDLAKSRAKQHVMSIEYIVGDVYKLPLDDASIDGIICSDVLEHLLDLPSAFQEIHRVLKPQGILTFDTINRTPVSYYLSIWILQDILKAMQGDAHDHKLYVTPQETKTLMLRSGLQPGPHSDLVGMRPGLQFPHVALFRLFTGRGFIASFLAEFKLTRDLSISYLHWCSKASES